MRELTDEDWIYRVVGIDNGTNTVGYATIDGDLRTGKGIVSRTETLTADKTSYEKFQGLSESRGMLAGRLRVIATYTREYIDEEDPDEVGAESPFSHLHAHSFALLTTSMTVIDNAVYSSRAGLPFEKVPPGRAKKAVCPPGKYSNKKEDIRQFILDDPDIIAGPGIILHEESEHVIDGISVGWYLFRQAYLAIKLSQVANNMSVSPRSRKK